MIWAVLRFGCGVGPTGFMWKRLSPQPGGVEVVRPLRSGTQLEVIAGPFSCLSEFLSGDTVFS